MSLSVPFLGRTTGFEKSGAAVMGRAVSLVRGLDMIWALLMTNHYIVSPKGDAGKLSFNRENAGDDFRFARTAQNV
jgi:hypothetical protein